MRSVGSGSRAQPPSSASAQRQAGQQARSRSRRAAAAHVALTPAGHEDVARIAHRPDELRMLGIGLDLPAQPHDAQVDAAVERIPVALLARVAGCARARAGGSGVRRAPSADRTRAATSGPPSPFSSVRRCAARSSTQRPMRTRSAPISARRGRRGAAQHALDARQQLARIEGLGHVVVGAHLEADDAVDHRGRPTSA